MKLLTLDVIKKLDSNPLYSKDGQGKDAEVIVKFFYPYGSGTWLVTEAEQDQETGDWTFYGAAEIGYGWEWGYTNLSQLTEVKKFGAPAIERDRGFKGTVGDVWKD